MSEKCCYCQVSKSVIRYARNWTKGTPEPLIQSQAYCNTQPLHEIQSILSKLSTIFTTWNQFPFHWYDLNIWITLALLDRGAIFRPWDTVNSYTNYFKNMLTAWTHTACLLGLQSPAQSRRENSLKCPSLWLSSLPCRIPTVNKFFK